jgi:AcrR family transcriptional regulator
MAPTEKVKELDATTESKIKDAARAVFLRKGYSATRTRDISEEAGINLALLNYYFRSKEKLFGIIMFETLYEFMQNMTGVFNDEKTSLQEKVEIIATKYIDNIIENPEVPLFIMSELRNDVAGFLEKLPVANMILSSSFMRQHKEAVANGKLNEPNPLHFIMNLISLIMFPFIGSHLIKKIGNLENKDFEHLMEQRKKMIPIWVKSMFFQP